MDLKELILDIRISCCLTQDELAKNLGMSPSSISLYQRGKRKASLLNLTKIVKFAVNEANIKVKVSEIDQ